MPKVMNRGRNHRRTKWVSRLRPHEPNREKVFAEEWEKENKPHNFWNFGFGILQDLFIDRDPQFLFRYVCSHRISNRERMIVATAIQWLGTNCGFCWLQETLRKCGYELKKIDGDKYGRKN